MIDSEVLRLRKLRMMALRTRALAKFLEADTAVDKSLFARSAVICWTIARLATGRLRAHPYLSFQKGPSPLRELADSVIASATAFVARRQGRRLSVLTDELHGVARQVDDARALTWTPELSDALGRMQFHLRTLAQELGAGAQCESGAAAMPRANAMLRLEASGALDEVAVETNWPYLAI
jgi:hypothetical protein